MLVKPTTLLDLCRARDLLCEAGELEATCADQIALSFNAPLAPTVRLHVPFPMFIDRASGHAMGRFQLRRTR